VIRRFHAAHPDIRIDYISGPWSTDERQNMYIRAFLAEDAFELVYMDVIWTAKFASQGWLLPLDRWFSPEVREKLIPQGVEAGFYQGHFYRVPVRTDVGMLYYRKDLVPEPPGPGKNSRPSAIATEIRRIDTASSFRECSTRASCATTSNISGSGRNLDRQDQNFSRSR